MEMQTCAVCGEDKSWLRFRKQLGGGLMESSSICSTCRNRLAAAKCRKKKQFEQQVVLNRTNHEYQIANKIPNYYPKLERAMRTYCNKKTAMDRKYLRDHQDEPLSHRADLARAQATARQRAKGWIAFYDEILNHAINLLRQTGTRPSWAQLEGKADLHRLYGLSDTKRAQLLRERG